MGPAVPVIGRIRNLYLMELLVKLPLNRQQMVRYKKIMLNHFNLLQVQPRYRSVQIIVDVDAY